MGHNRSGISCLIAALLALPAAAQTEKGPVQSVDGIKTGAWGVDTLVHIVNGEDQDAMGLPFCCDLGTALYEPCGYPITARSFGAKGDGTTDDATAIPPINSMLRLSGLHCESASADMPVVTTHATRPTSAA